MQYIQGTPHNQLLVSSLEEKITADNPVRFMEAFVHHIDVLKVGFQPKFPKRRSSRVKPVLGTIIEDSSIPLKTVKKR